MTSPRKPAPGRHQRSRWTVLWVVVGMLILGLLAVMPGAWALPEQAPDFQTVPTLTPTPTRIGAGATSTPRPVDTPTPLPGATATDTPPGATATSTPPPGATATSTPTLPPGVTATSTPTRSAPRPVQPGATPCWTVPTPGFVAARAAALNWSAASDQSLVVPGQTVILRLRAENTGASPLFDALICNPLDPALIPGQPIATQGQARVEPEGLVVELGDLAAGQAVQVELSLRIPADHPLGGVIESQAWLFSGEQRASTDLLTWALPPVYLPPTGQ